MAYMGKKIGKITIDKFPLLVVPKVSLSFSISEEKRAAVNVLIQIFAFNNVNVLKG
jgi:hypothetical protein